jgi:hypothetical protein
VSMWRSSLNALKTMDKNPRQLWSDMPSFSIWQMSIYGREMKSCLKKRNQQDNCNHSIVGFPARVPHLVEKLQHFYSCPWPLP